MTQLPLSVDDLRMWALKFTARQLGRGYTVSDAEASEGFGCFAPGEPGFEIRRGVLCVGWWTDDKKSPSRFKFAELVETLDKLKGAVIEFEGQEVAVQEILL